MIDLAHLRRDPAWFTKAFKERGAKVDIDGLLALDSQVRELKTAAEALKFSVNSASKEIGIKSKAGAGAEAISSAKEHARQLGDQAKATDERRAVLEKQLNDQLLLIPNPCQASVPIGVDSKDNRVVSTWGDAPTFAFTPKPHWDLGPALGILDFERASKLSGSGFVALRGAGARLNRALISWFLDLHTNQHGYTELAPPYLVQSQMMVGTGQLPKFADQFYVCRDDDLVLIPTAEVPVTNLHAGEILNLEDLPVRYTAHTPCFRREAGAAGVGTRGMTRVHQFDKVEVVWLTTPERSDQDLLTLRGHAEILLQQLGLHYRVLELCTGDTGFSSCHTYDLEVWSPGTKTWLEVSSCSTFGDFQARRAGLRYRTEKGGKPVFLHTLNGSALALPRCLIALMETYQQQDGSLTIPAVLRPYVGGLDKIGTST